MIGMSTRTEIDAFEDLQRVMADLDKKRPAFEKSERGSREAMELGREVESLKAKIPQLLNEITSIVKTKYNLP
jgi:hypothetical protein